MAVQKRKRNKPCKPRGVDSRGLRRGARPTRQAELEKVLAGKGQYASIESVEVRQTFGRWMADRQRIILGER